MTDHSGQVAARTVPEHREPAGVPVQLVRVLNHPLDRGIRIVNRGGKRVLRGEPIVDGNHYGVGVMTVEARDRIVGVEIPGHEAGAVKMHHQRKWPVCVGRAGGIHPETDFASRHRHRSIGNVV